MRWISRETVNVDRIACCWLISRYVDYDATFIFVPPEEIEPLADRIGAIVFDATGELSRTDDRPCFAVLIERFSLGYDPVLLRLAQLVRRAGSKRRRIGGGIGCSLRELVDGLALLYPRDDHRLSHALPLFDAIYAVGCTHVIASGVAAQPFFDQPVAVLTAARAMSAPAARPRRVPIRT